MEEPANHWVSAPGSRVVKGVNVYGRRLSQNLGDPGFGIGQCPVSGRHQIEEPDNIERFWFCCGRLRELG